MTAKMPARKSRTKKGPLAKNYTQIGVRIPHRLNVALYKAAARRAELRHSIAPVKSELVIEALLQHPEVRRHLAG